MPFQRHNEQIACWYSRLSFPKVWEAKPIIRDGQAVGEPNFSTIVILHDEIVKRIQAIEDRLIAQTWPEWVGGQPPPGIILKRALKRGETVRPGDPYLAGKWILNANAKKESRPWIAKKDPATGNYIPVTDRSLIYSGCEAHVHVGLYTTQIKIAEPQIDVGLNGLEPTGRALPSFDGRMSAEQALGGGPDIAAPPVPTEGADVAVPSYASQEASPDTSSYDPMDPTTW